MRAASRHLHPASGWISVLVLAGTGTGVRAELPASDPGLLLTPGVALERPVDPPPAGAGVEHAYHFEIRAGERAAVFVEQLAADVRLEARWPELEEPWRVDAPLDHDGVEVLLLPPAARGRVTVRLAALLPGGPDADPEVRRSHPSRYRIRLETRAEVADRLPWLETLGRLTAAGRAWADGTGEGRRRALDFYGRVAGEAVETDVDPRLVAQAVHAEAVLHRLLGEHGPAREHARRALERWQDLGDRRRLADAWNEIGLVEGPDGHTAEAREAFAAATALARELDDPFRLAVFLGNGCLVELMENRLRQGIDCYTAALPAVRRIGDRETESAHLTNMAQAHKVLGEPDAALELYLAALGIQRSQGLAKLEAQTLNNLAGLHRGRGDFEAALDAYARALELFERLGDERWRARSLHNLASTYARLGDLESARRLADRALELHRRLGNAGGEASALKILGHLAAAGGDQVAARDAYARARDLERATGDVPGEALATAFVGRAELAAGHAAAARPLLAEALDRLRAADRPQLVAAVLVDQGRALLALDQADAAGRLFEEALALYQRLEDSRGRGWALYQLAEAAERSGGAAGRSAALARLRQAVEAFDAVTLELEDPDLRAFFAGSQRAARERYVARLLDAGDEAAALAASEAARAWGLRTVLGPADPRGELGAGPGSVAALDLDGIRRLLDPQTVLLEYLTGEERSHLFVITGGGAATDRAPPGGIEVFPVAGRAELEAAVRAARDELLAGAGRTGAMARLADLLLAPAWPALDRPRIRRLALALDGPLHYLPVAALPLPRTAAGPDGGIVADRFELIRLPSAAVLALDRRRRAVRPPARSGVAVLADPIFTADDLRLPRAAPPADAGPGEAASPFLPRLRSSRREAEAVVAAVGSRETLVALDAEADREWLLSEALADYRILHLATHARVDDTAPLRSGLELSRFDAAGDPREGFLGVSRLRRLSLRAELVVLSACRTAIGTEIRGEGLVGLVQAFLEAGGSRVIASLWPVSDRATAELVDRLYGALADGEPPAAALRRAQSELRADRRFRRPADWAGFVMVGDWQGGELRPRAATATAPRP